MWSLTVPLEEEGRFRMCTCPAWKCSINAVHIGLHNCPIFRFEYPKGDPPVHLSQNRKAHLRASPGSWGDWLLCLFYLLSEKNQSHFCHFQVFQGQGQWGMAEASPRTWEQPPGPMCTDVEGFVGLCFHSLPLHQQASQCRALPGKEEGSAAPRALRAREAISGAAASCASVHRLCPPAEVGLLSGQAGLWWRDGVG